MFRSKVIEKKEELFLFAGSSYHRLRSIWNVYITEHLFYLILDVLITNNNINCLVLKNRINEMEWYPDKSYGQIYSVGSQRAPVILEILLRS